MTKKEIGVLINDTRRAQDMTIYRLSKKTGLINSQIKNIEENRSDYTFCSLIKVLNALDLKLIIK